MRARVAGVALATRGVSDSPLEWNLRTLGTRALTSLRRSRAAAGTAADRRIEEIANRGLQGQEFRQSQRDLGGLLGHKDAFLLEPAPKVAP
jgi:hypothetical protein